MIYLKEEGCVMVPASVIAQKLTEEEDAYWGEQEKELLTKSIAKLMDEKDSVALDDVTIFLAGESIKSISLMTGMEASRIPNVVMGALQLLRDAKEEALQDDALLIDIC